jgi:hypothetical protein
MDDKASGGLACQECLLRAEGYRTAYRIKPCRRSIQHNLQLDYRKRLQISQPTRRGILQEYTKWQIIA